MGNKDNAQNGTIIEDLFRTSISDHPKVIDSISKELGIPGSFYTAILNGSYRGKADVELGFILDHKGYKIGASVKAFVSGFNQLTQISFSRFSKMFELEEADKADLKNLFIAKERNHDLNLFGTLDNIKWKTLINKKTKELLKTAFSDTPDREILVLYNIDTRIMSIYSMKKVLRYLSKKVVLTRGGANIGESITLQKKGGDGNVTRYERDDIRHPCNNVQLKIHTKKFAEVMEKALIAQYKV